VKLSFTARMQEMGFELKDLTDSVIREFAEIAPRLSKSIYRKAKDMAASRLHSTRDQYIAALHEESPEEGIYIVYLDPEADYIEDGYPPFPMLPKLFSGPKAKTAKDGHKYVIIPMRQRTAPINPSNKQQADLSDRLRSEIKMRQWKTSKAGTNKAGKYATTERMVSGKSTHPYLKGLTRVREYESKEAKEKGAPPMSSSYFTFRVASQKQDPSKMWRHPGFAGARIWPELEKWAEFELEQIINDVIDW